MAIGPIPAPGAGGFWPHLCFPCAFSCYCRHFCIPRSILDLQHCRKLSAQLRINLFWPKNRAPPGKTLANTPACNYRPINALQTFPAREFCPRVGQNPVLAWQNPVCAKTPQESVNCLTTRILRFWPRKCRFVILDPRPARFPQVIHNFSPHVSRAASFGDFTCNWLSNTSLQRC